MTIFKEADDFFDLEQMDDAHQWAKDTTKWYQKKAAENPFGWHARMLKLHKGNFPIANLRRPVKISIFEKTINVKKLEEETLKILERW